MKDKQEFALWKDMKSVLSRRDCLNHGLAFVDLASRPEKPVPPLGSHLCLSLPTGVRSSEGEASRLSLGPGASSLLTPLCPADLLEARRPLAHEYLGEALRMMRQIISKYPLLNTVESLTAAGTLIAKIRGQLAPGTAVRAPGAPGGLPGGRDV